MKETTMRKRQVSSSSNTNNNIPAFGEWDDCDDLPITQYFESAAQAGLLRGRSFQEPPYAAAGHAFNLSSEPVRPTYRQHQHRRRPRPNDDHPRKQVRRSGVVEREYVQCGMKEQQRKQQLQGRVVVAQNVVVAAGPSPRKPPRAPKAVDEDLYKIPPEFLYEKPRRKKLLRNLWSGCLGLNCVA